ncbi:MAG: PF20097 family protein [Thermoplasmata archaeon]
MTEGKCATCGGPLVAGFISTTNGSGLEWGLDATDRRLRPNGLEVLVPTGFSGTFSANLPGLRCASCRTVLVQLKK